MNLREIGCAVSPGESALPGLSNARFIRANTEEHGEVKYRADSQTEQHLPTHSEGEFNPCT